MDDLARELERTRAAVRVDWSDARQNAGREGILRRLRRQARARVASRIVSVAAVIVVAVVAVTRSSWWSSARSPNASTAEGPRERRLPLADGSTVIVPRDGMVTPIEANAQRVVLRVDRGRAEFDVVHDPSRVFRVEAGDVAVQVLGTRFVVERETTGAHVAVLDGRVRVFWGDRYADLARGEERSFAPDSTGFPVGGLAAAERGSTTAEGDAGGPIAEQNALVRSDANAGSDASIESTLPARSNAAPPVARWRALAEHGDFDAAFEAIRHAGSNAVHDNVSELLAAADAARMSAHANEAAVFLRQILDRHATDPRAPLSAFTLGRVLMDDLGRPRDAAEAFATARRLGPRSDLAEDALAREVEAWSRGGDSAHARAAAEEYVRTYPSGQRSRSVRRFGGLE